MSNVATMIIFSITMKALDGKLTLTAGRWMINCIPLISPQTCARHPDITVCKTALPTTVATVAADPALPSAYTALIEFPGITCLTHGLFKFMFGANPLSIWVKSMNI